MGKSSCTPPVAVWFSLSSHYPLLCPLNSSAIDGIYTATDGVLICSCGLLSFAASPSRRPRSWCLTGCVTGVRTTLQSLELAISFTFNIRVILTHRQTETCKGERDHGVSCISLWTYCSKLLYSKFQTLLAELHAYEQ